MPRRGQSQAPAPQPFDHLLRRNTCHGSPRDFRTPSDKCTSCHIHWEAGTFDHKVTGLVLSEDHLDLDCSDCHLEMDFSARPSCEDCHDEPMLPEKLPGTRM
jgi:hypothetical protein